MTKKKTRKTDKAKTRAGEAAPRASVQPRWQAGYPRVEMVTAWRLVAGLDGLPARCPDRRCRRLGQCAATVVDEHETPCAAIAGETTLRRMEAAMWGVLAHWWHVMEDAGEAPGILEWAEAARREKAAQANGIAKS